METPTGTIGSENAKCYGMFHRPDDKKAYHKPTRLIHELKILFPHRPVLSAIIAHEQLKSLKDTDGSGLFDYSKRGEVKNSHKILKNIKIGMAAVHVQWNPVVYVLAN